MKKIKTYALNACAYTVVLLFIFFFFVATSGSASLALTLTSFLSIFAIGCIISLSRLVFGIQRLSYPLRAAIHFLALLASLFALLFTTGYLNGKTPSSYIVLVFIYAIVYAVVWVISYFSKKWAKALFAREDKTKKAKSENKKTAEYKPLYK